MKTPTLRLRNKFNEIGSQWFCEPHETDKIKRAVAELAEFERLEPNSGWKLETQGEALSWHVFNAEIAECLNHEPLAR